MIDYDSFSHCHLGTFFFAIFEGAKELKKKSALVKHVCLNGHRDDWESSAILAIESDYKKRRFLESFYIHKTDFSFNDKINSFYLEL